MPSNANRDACQSFIRGIVGHNIDIRAAMIYRMSLCHDIK